MKELRAARRYATALFGLADRAGRTDAFEAELLRVRKVLEDQPALRGLMINPTLRLDDKERILDTKATRLSREVRDFLKVLIRKRRFVLFPEIQQAFHRLYEIKKGLQEVRILSAVPLRAGTQERLAAVFRKKLRSEIRLTAEVQRGLLGGLIARFEGKEIDLSCRSRLNALTQILMD